MSDTYVNKNNLENINETLTNLFKNSDFLNVDSPANISELFNNPNLIAEKMQDQCASLKTLTDIANNAIGDSTFSAQTSTDVDGNAVYEDFNAGFGGIDANEIINQAMSQTQSTVNNACSLVADKMNVIKDLTGILDKVKDAMASGDIDAIKKVQTELNTEVQKAQTANTNTKGTF